MLVHQFGCHPQAFCRSGAGFNEVRRRRISHLFADPFGRQPPQVVEQPLGQARCRRQELASGRRGPTVRCLADVMARTWPSVSAPKVASPRHVPPSPSARSVARMASSSAIETPADDGLGTGLLLGRPVQSSVKITRGSDCPVGLRPPAAGGDLHQCGAVASAATASSRRCWVFHLPSLRALGETPLPLWIVRTVRSWRWPHPEDGRALKGHDVEVRISASAATDPTRSVLTGTSGAFAGTGPCSCRTRSNRLQGSDPESGRPVTELNWPTGSFAGAGRSGLS